MLPFLVAQRQLAIFRSGSADDNADDFANQQRAAGSRGPMSSMESDTEADTDNILSHGGDLNALSNNRRRRRHKQASPTLVTMLRHNKFMADLKLRIAATYRVSHPLVPLDSVMFSFGICELCLGSR